MQHLTFSYPNSQPAICYNTHYSMVVLPFRIDTTDELSLWRANTFFDKEPETIEWLKFFSNKSNSTNLLVDVGANIGLYTLFWLSLNTNNRAIAIEPFDENRYLLEKNLRMNAFLKRCQIVPNPLSADTRLIKAVIPDKRPGASSFSIIEHGTAEKVVFSSTLDIIMNSSSEKFLLKIDVDGSEMEILNGAKVAFSKKLIFSSIIETNSLTSKDVENFFASYGYQRQVSFDNTPKHSTLRRKAQGKSERNIVFSA